MLEGFRQAHWQEAEDAIKRTDPDFAGIMITAILQLPEHLTNLSLGDLKQATNHALRLKAGL
jgi:hypothetical protein